MTDARWLWSSQSVGARIARGALVPLSGVFRAASSLRAALYDAGLLRAHDLGAPAVSVGNLTVGGTGKTPFASWLAMQLAARGAKPGVLLRGYGGDEIDVHRTLAPSAIVIANQDRIAGAREARARGADVLVLDDAFQHRRAARLVDIVLVSADAAGVARWPLPAGPWREPLNAVRRARLVIVTAKAAPDRDIEVVLGRVTSAGPGVATGVVRFEANTIVRWGSTGERAASELRGTPVLAVCAIGDPGAFVAQLRSAGLSPTPAIRPDHHRFTAEEAQALAREAQRVGSVVCTLKDAVKLGPLWPPGAPPLWYLSQRLRVERGAEMLAALIAELVAARRASQSTEAPRTSL